MTGKCALVGNDSSVLNMLYAFEPKSWRIGSKTWCYSSGNEYVKQCMNRSAWQDVLPYSYGLRMDITDRVVTAISTADALKPQLENATVAIRGNEDFVIPLFMLFPELSRVKDQVIFVGNGQSVEFKLKFNPAVQWLTATVANKAVGIPTFSNMTLRYRYTKLDEERNAAMKSSNIPIQIYSQQTEGAKDVNDNVNLTFDLSRSEKVHGLFFGLHSPLGYETGAANTTLDVTKFYGAAASAYAGIISP